MAKNSSSSNNNLIVKNTAFLYFRMIFSMGITLYTSRLILTTLGIEDFGIYNVIGGMVSMFLFLNTAMSNATSRFFTFEIGKGKDSKISIIFSVSLTTHLIIIGVIFLLCESIGVWFLNSKMVIPEDRLFAANVVLQVSIIASLINILQVPYRAIVVSYERMDMYAYIEIFNVILKLLIVVALMYATYDKLITYSYLYLATCVVVFLIYAVYANFRCTGANFSPKLDRVILKPMLAFTGWDFYGNASVVARTQGVNMLLNMYFGPVLNAANGIATQVQGAAMSFAANVMTAFKPQIIKSYASDDFDRMNQLTFAAGKFATVLMLLTSIPLMIEMEFVLTVWLGDWPKDTADLCRLTILFNMLSNLSAVLIMGIHATGNVRRPNVINGTIYLLVIPITYMIYKYIGAGPLLPFVINIIAVIIGLLCNMWTLSILVQSFKLKEFFVSIFIKCSIIGLVTYGLTYIIHTLLVEGWGTLFFIICISSIILLFLSYSILMDSTERDFINKIVKSKVHNFK